MDNLRTDIKIDEIKRPQRSSLKSAPVSDQFRYKFPPNFTRDEKKKSVTFICDMEDSRKNSANESIMQIIEKCDTEGDCQNDHDEYIANFMRANNLQKTNNSNSNEFTSDEHMYSQEGPKRLSKRKTSLPKDEDVKVGKAPETEQSEYCSEAPKRLHRKSNEHKTNDIEDCTETNRKNCDQIDLEVVDENSSDDEGINSNDRPVKHTRRNTVAGINSSIKKLSLGDNLTERDQQRKASEPPGIGRKRKSAVFALNPEFRAQLEKQNEEKLQKKKLLERRKTEPATMFLRNNDDTITFADLTESREEQTSKTNEEKQSNSINALYSAKNKISNVLYITKGKISNRPPTYSEEHKAKPLVRGIPYHSEMRMKRRGTISLHLKSIYLDDAERKIKSKRKLSTENNSSVKK